MIEEYKEIGNGMPDMYNAPDASNTTMKTSTLGRQQLELWSPVGKSMHQKKVKSEGNQMENTRVLRVTTGNATK